MTNYEKTVLIPKGIDALERSALMYEGLALDYAYIDPERSQCCLAMARINRAWKDCPKTCISFGRGVK